jgi:hypothetical protein
VFGFTPFYGTRARYGTRVAPRWVCFLRRADIKRINNAQCSYSLFVMQVFRINTFDLSAAGGARPRIARMQWWPPAVPLAPRQENSSHTLLLQWDTLIAFVADPDPESGSATPNWKRILSVFTPNCYQAFGNMIRGMLSLISDPGSGFFTCGFRI